MKVSMPSGRAHGWGIAGDYLTREIARLPKIEGVTLHCIANHELRPMDVADWNRINIGYCFFENDIEILRHSRRAARQWDFIVAGSSWCEYQLRIGGVKQTATILQGIDPTNFHQVPFREDDDRFIVFSGGKFEYRKGQDLVIAAMRIFMQRHHNAYLACSWISPIQ
jgi:glycosyltransferase involved in cell wall biosynthesis